jgi:hypothetical protein
MVYLGIWRDCTNCNTDSDSNTSPNCYANANNRSNCHTNASPNSYANTNDRSNCHANT